MPSSPRTSCACLLAAALLLACRKDRPTTPPPTTATPTNHAPTQSTEETKAVVDPPDELEGFGVAPTVEPGDERSGLYAQPGDGEGPRTKVKIRAVIRSHIAAVRGCYERGLVRQADLAGTVRVDFIITPQGTVSEAHAQPGFPVAEVSDCIVGVVKGLAFEPSEAHGNVDVSYPFVLKTSE